MFDRVKRLFGRAEPEVPPGPDLEELEQQQAQDEPPPPPPKPDFYLGAAPAVEAEIEWSGNIHDEGWDLADYPGHVFGMDPDTGQPNRILDAAGRKVADITADGEVTEADTWYG